MIKIKNININNNNNNNNINNINKICGNDGAMNTNYLHLFE